MDKFIGVIRSRKGQELVEYMLMMGVVIGAVLVVGTMFKSQIGGVFSSVMRQINDAAMHVSSPTQ